MTRQELLATEARVRWCLPMNGTAKIVVDSDYLAATLPIKNCGAIDFEIDNHGAENEFKIDWIGVECIAEVVPDLLHKVLIPFEAILSIEPFPNLRPE